MSRTNICSLSAFSCQLSVSEGLQKTRPSACDADPKNPPQPQQRRTRVSDPHGLNPLIAEWAMSGPHGSSSSALDLHRIGAGACPVGRAVLMTGSRAAARTFHALVLSGAAQDLPRVGGGFGDVGWA